MPVINDFGIESVAVGDVASGFVLIKVDTLSIDAWIRTTLSDAGMHETAAIGETIPALGVGQIVESNSSDLVAGDWVYGLMSAQTHALMPASGLRKLNT